MLDITEELLQELGISSYKLTGSTPSDSRQEMTRAFNQGSRDAFLISLKAGGVGLNLTGADTETKCRSFPFDYKRYYRREDS